MAMREATPEEIAALMGDEAPAPKQSGMREATPEEIQALMGDSAPTIKPGDVAARQKQMDALAATEKPNVVRERLAPGGILGAPIGIANEFFSGVGDTARNLGNLLSPDAYKGVVDNPIAGTALGVARAVSSPTAPVSDLAASLGEDLSQSAQKAGFTTLADLLGATSMAVADVAAPLAGARYLKKVEQGIKATPRLENALLKSRRTQANEAKTALSQAETKSAAKLSEVQADLATNKEGIGQLRETAEEMLPTKADLQKQFADKAPLGKDAGGSWKQSFSNKWNESKEKFNRLYGEITDEGAAIEAMPESYMAAGGRVEKAMGVTGVPKAGAAEGVAAKLRKTMDLDRFEDDTYKALKEQLDGVGPADKARVQGVIDEFKAGNEMPEIPTVRDLVIERQRLKAGQRATRGDYAKKQFEGLIKGLEDDIANANEGIAQKLFSTDARYATEHAPYFTQGTVTRAIGTGKAEAVVDSIYRPTISASGKTGSNTKALEAITRAREVITDPQEWQKINKAFINKGIEFASDGDALDPKKMVQWWKSYKDVAGTNNEVLRKGLGEQSFREIDSVFTQLDRAPKKTLDGLAKDLVHSFEGRAKEATAIETAHIKATRAALEKQIGDLMGTKVGKITDKLQSIGAGVFTSGTIGDGPTSARAVKGGVIVMTAKAVGTLLETTRGRSLLKAVMRGTPNMAQRAATARQIERLANATQQEED